MDADLYLIVGWVKYYWDKGTQVIGYCSSKAEAYSMVDNIRKLERKYSKQWGVAKTDALERKATNEGRAGHDVSEI